MNRYLTKTEVSSIVLENESSHNSVVEVSQDTFKLPLWLTVSMVAERLSLGKTKVYELIDSAGLPVVHVGRAVRVPTARFLRWVEEFEKRSLVA